MIFPALTWVLLAVSAAAEGAEELFIVQGLHLFCRDGPVLIIVR